MAVTIDRFELIPGAAPATGAAAQAAGSGGAAASGDASPPPPSRHEVLRALRLEHSRLARVRAH
ncbi:hypothetical protein [Sorangium sp. So ce887]|uniref:hypothetical protein n=1 Tax=Sorangium sp. So ce887 TaxID=3133324 RepID=UPI003F62DA29